MDWITIRIEDNMKIRACNVAAHEPKIILKHAWFGRQLPPSVIIRVLNTFSRITDETLHIFRVGQNHIYTVYIRYFRLGNHLIYGVYIRIYTVLANPTYLHWACFSMLIIKLYLNASARCVCVCVKLYLNASASDQILAATNLIQMELTRVINP